MTFEETYEKYKEDLIEKTELNLSIEPLLRKFYEAGYCEREIKLCKEKIDEVKLNAYLYSVSNAFFGDVQNGLN